MGQILYKGTKATKVIRKELRQSKITIPERDKQYNLNPKTILKRKHRETEEDSLIDLKRVCTVYSKQEEVMICAFHCKTQLSLDSCYIAFKKYISTLSRSNLHRCLKRFDFSQLSKNNKKPDKKLFKKYKVGYFHVNICEAQISTRKVYLYAVVDRTCKHVYAKIHSSPTAKAAADFLKNLVVTVLCKIHTVLIDNGVQCSLILMKKRYNYQAHVFKQVCQITRRLTQFKHSWTTDQIKRANRMIKQLTLKIYHYDIIDSLKCHFYDFLNMYNFAQKLESLKCIASMQKILAEFLAEFQNKPHLFHSNPHYHLLGLSN